MGFSTRCRYWFILQVVAIVVCHGVKASSNIYTVQDCVGSRLDLMCPPEKVIRVTNIYRGLSSCNGATCCISGPGCVQRLSEEHEKSVHSRCDGQQNCTVDISFQKMTCISGRRYPDGYAYERVTYTCKDDPGDNVTSNNETHTKLPENNMEEDDKSIGVPTEILLAVVVIIGLMMLIAIVVLAVIIYRRKILPQSNQLLPVEMTEIDNGKNETAQGTSQHENTVSLPPMYSITGNADSPETQEDLTIYSDVEIRILNWNQNDFDRTIAKPSPTHNAFNPTQNADPDVYPVTNKPSQHAATSYAVKTEEQGRKDFAKTEEMASTEMEEDIYVNEPTIVSSNRSVTGTVSRTPSPKDKGDVTVIENDLYCH